MRTRPVYANCPFGLVYLILRGLAAYVILAPGGNWLIPWHMGAVTKRGHLLHFRRRLPHAQNPYGGWWFLGSFEGLNRSRWAAVLAKRGRVRRLPTWLALMLCVLGYLLLFLPWVATWALFGPAWSLRWALQGWSRRRAG